MLKGRGKRWEVGVGPGAGQGQRAGVAQVGEASGQVLQGGMGGGAGG